MRGHIMIDVPSARAIASTSHKGMRPHVLGGRYVEVVDFTWFPFTSLPSRLRQGRIISFSL